MSQLNLQEIIELVQNNKTDLAAELLNSFTDNLDPSERGQAYVDLANVYLDIQAAQQDELLELLDEQINKLKIIDREEKAIIR